MKPDQIPREPRHGELAELIRLLRDRVDPKVEIAAGPRFDRFLGELDTIDESDLPPGDGRLDRWQDRLIQEQITEGATVLDIGCGSGVLLSRLQQRKRVRGQGIELNSEQLAACVRRGVPVLQADIDDGLKGFPDGCFEYVVLEETLQTLHRPTAVLEEMLRVGRCGIVSFPNFGYWRVRLDYLVRGGMPVSPRLPYRWYDTPNIHHLTLRDFLGWCAEAGADVDQAFALSDEGVRPMQDGDNLYAAEILLFLSKR